MLQTGDVLAGKYRVERVLGKGGMGYVVAAIHTQLEERVAIKLLMPELCAQDEPVARFLREARAAVRIRSEHVARVLDVGVLDDGAPYMVMEYLEGHDLAGELDRRMQLNVHEAVEYLLQACEAIAEAHARGIVHRDLKPANLFLTRRADGSPLIKVLDFGISKAIVADGAEASASLTATQSLLGSPHYMSPEQVRKPKSVDARTDIWSLGVILYELLTGALPFSAENAMSVLAAVVSDPTPRLRDTRPDIPEALDSLVTRCLSKEPGQRFADVAEFASALLPFAPASAVPSIKRISGVLRSSGEGSNPLRDSGARSPVPSPRAQEQATLVSESDRPEHVITPAPELARDPNVSTDPTLRADWAPRFASEAAVLRSGETASQWEHSKPPLPGKPKKNGSRLALAIGLAATFGGAGYALSRRSSSVVQEPLVNSTSAAQQPSASPSALVLGAAPASSERAQREAASVEPSSPALDAGVSRASEVVKPETTPTKAKQHGVRDLARPLIRHSPPATGQATTPPAAPSAASEAPPAHKVDPLDGRR